MTPQTSISTCNDGEEFKVTLTPYALDVCITFEHEVWGFKQEFWFDKGNPKRIEEAYEKLCKIARHVVDVRSTDLDR